MRWAKPRISFILEPVEEFKFRLARDLGYRSVARLERGMSHAEFIRWIVFYKREDAREAERWGKNG